MIRLLGLMGQREYIYLRCLKSFPCLMKKGTGLAALQVACVVVLEARTCCYEKSDEIGGSASLLLLGTSFEFKSLWDKQSSKAKITQQYVATSNTSKDKNWLCATCWSG